jgi:hypothetical protein
MSSFRTEWRMVASTVGGLLSGRQVWLPKSEPTASDWIIGTRKGALPIAVAELRQQHAAENEGLERVRQRAQFALTAVIAAVGLSLTDVERVIGASARNLWIACVWGLGIAVVVLASLIFAGVFVARKEVGLAKVSALAGLPTPGAQRALLREYQRAIDVTRHTRYGAITVFRDAILLALLGLALVFGAHLAATVAPASTNRIEVDLYMHLSDALPGACSASRDQHGFA